MTPQVRQLEEVFPGIMLEVSINPFQPTSGIVHGKERVRLKREGAKWTGTTPAKAIMLVAGEWERYRSLMQGLLGNKLKLDDMLVIRLDENTPDQVWRLMSLADTPYVVLAGNGPKSLWRKDLSVSDVIGHIGIWGEYLNVVCCHDPETIKRNRRYIPPTSEAMRLFAEMVDKNETPLEYIRHFCVKCSKPEKHIDPDGMAWCEKHWFDGGKSGGIRAWEIQREELMTDVYGTHTLF